MAELSGCEDKSGDALRISAASAYDARTNPASSSRRSHFMVRARWTVMARVVVDSAGDDPDVTNAAGDPSPRLARRRTPTLDVRIGGRSGGAAAGKWIRGGLVPEGRTVLEAS